MDGDTSETSLGKNVKDDEKRPLIESGGGSNSNKAKSVSSGPTDIQSDLHKSMVDRIKSSLRRYVLGSPIGLFKKKLETWAQKRISGQKDQELRKNNQRLNTVLIFGTEPSGKSTIIKQRRMLYDSNFDEEEKKEIVSEIADQKDNRRTWIYFHGLSVLIFAAACNSHDIILRVFNTSNKLLLAIAKLHLHSWMFMTKLNSKE